MHYKFFKPEKTLKRLITTVTLDDMRPPQQQISRYDEWGKSIDDSTTEDDKVVLTMDENGRQCRAE